VLKNTYKKKLIDRMNIIRWTEMIESCKDCIFKKMHTWVYNKEVNYKKVLLEQVHVNL